MAKLLFLEFKNFFVFIIYNLTIIRSNVNIYFFFLSLSLSLKRILTFTILLDRCFYQHKIEINEIKFCINSCTIKIL